MRPCLPALSLACLAILLFPCTASFAQETSVEEGSKTVQPGSVLRTLFSPFEHDERELIEEASPRYPVMIRVRKDVFLGASDKRIDVLSPVDQVIVDTPVTGTSRITGSARIHAQPSQDCALFLVAFQGKSRFNTIGENGPARIHSHGQTDFVVQRKIRFTADEGFIAEPTLVTTSTYVSIDSIDSSMNGLRGRLVRRIAARRAEETRPLATAIVDGDTRKSIEREVDEFLDPELAQLNKKFRLARYATRILGKGDYWDMQVSSATDCLQIAFGAESGEASKQTFPKDCPQSPVEIWVHGPSVGSALPLLVEALVLAGSSSNTTVATLPMFRAIVLQSAPASSVEGLRIRWEGKWAVLMFHPSEMDFDNRPLLAQQETIGQ